jgi:hypothetical protein
MCLFPIGVVCGLPWPWQSGRVSPDGTSNPQLPPIEDAQWASLTAFLSDDCLRSVCIATESTPLTHSPVVLASAVCCVSGSGDVGCVGGWLGGGGCFACVRSQVVLYAGPCVPVPYFHVQSRRRHRLLSPWEQHPAAAGRLYALLWHWQQGVPGRCAIIPVLGLEGQCSLPSACTMCTFCVCNQCPVCSSCRAVYGR